MKTVTLFLFVSVCITQHHCKLKESVKFTLQFIIYHGQIKKTLDVFSTPFVKLQLVNGLTGAISEGDVQIKINKGKRKIGFTLGKKTKEQLDSE